MRKTLIATAVLLAAAAAQAAPAVGDTTNNSIYRAGATTFPNGHFHGPHDAPGVGFWATPGTGGSPGTGGYVISLQSIDPYSGDGTLSITGTSVVFNKYKLLGYTHQDDPSGPVITTNFHWARVAGATSQVAGQDPTPVDRRVYFGIFTDTSGTTPVYDSFYTGDPTDRVVPTATTNYATAAFLSLPTASASAPEILTGNLRYTTSGSGTLSTQNTSGVTTPLTNGTHDLYLSLTGNPTFSGTSSLANTGSSTPIGTGNASGQFFGSGSGSAVAGIAKGGSGANAYVASFGGIKK